MNYICWWRSCNKIQPLEKLPWDIIKLALDNESYVCTTAMSIPNHQLLNKLKKMLYFCVIEIQEILFFTILEFD